MKNYEKELDNIFNKYLDKYKSVFNKKGGFQASSDNITNFNIVNEEFLKELDLKINELNVKNTDLTDKLKSYYGKLYKDFQSCSIYPFD